MVRIQLCGRFTIVIDGQPAEPRLPGRQGRLLVAYLATYRAQPVERTVLLDALWPDAGPGAAGTLTVLLSKARTLLPPAEIRGRRTLQLVLPADSAVDLETATTSLHSAESAVALRDWRRAWPAALTAQYVSRRRFLAGFEAPWIDEWRRQLDVIYERALGCYGEACLGIGGGTESRLLSCRVGGARARGGGGGGVGGGGGAGGGCGAGGGAGRGAGARGGGRGVGALPPPGPRRAACPWGRGRAGPRALW